MKFPNVFNSMFQLKNKKEKEMANSGIESIKSIREVLVKEQEEKLMNENKNLLEYLIEQKNKIKQQIDTLIKKVELPSEE